MKRYEKSKVQAVDEICSLQVPTSREELGKTWDPACWCFTLYHKSWFSRIRCEKTTCDIAFPTTRHSSCAIALAATSKAQQCSPDKAFTLFEIAQWHSVNEQEMQASRLSRRTLFNFESQWNLEASHGVSIASNKLGSCGQSR
jgi:hypothetical protein